MAYEWFKLYTEARTDAKLRTLTDGQHRIWFNLLCFAADQPERGVIVGYDDDLLAVEVANGDAEALADTISRLAKLRILARAEDGTLSLTNWGKRQNVRTVYPSDSPEETRKRKQEQRAREQPHDVTSRHEPSRVSRHVTGIDVEGERDTDLEGDRDRSLHPDGDRFSDAGGGADAPSSAIRNDDSSVHVEAADDMPTLAQRPPLTIVPQTATPPKPPQPVPRRASDANELASYIPLARQIATEAKLMTYDALALARVVRRHSTHEPDRLVIEANKAAVWIADPNCNKRKRQMSPGFLDNWFSDIDKFKQGDNGHASRGSDRPTTDAGRSRPRTAAYRPVASPPPDPHRDGKYAAFANRG